MILLKSYSTDEYALVLELEDGVAMQFRHEWEIKEAMSRKKETSEFREMLKTVYAMKDYIIDSKTEITTTSKAVDIGAFAVAEEVVK